MTSFSLFNDYNMAPWEMNQPCHSGRRHYHAHSKAAWYRLEGEEEALGQKRLNITYLTRTRHLKVEFDQRLGTLNYYIYFTDKYFMPIHVNHYVANITQNLDQDASSDEEDDDVTTIALSTHMPRQHRWRKITQNITQRQIMQHTITVHSSKTSACGWPEPHEEPHSRRLPGFNCFWQTRSICPHDQSHRSNTRWGRGEIEMILERLRINCQNKL